MEQCQLPLSWRQVHGRHAISWMLRPDGSRPADGEELDPYGVFVAEVMRAARQHQLVESMVERSGRS